MASEHIFNELARKSKSLFLASIIENGGELEALGFVACSDRDNLVCEPFVAPNTVQPMKPFTVMHSPNPQPRENECGHFFRLHELALLLRRLSSTLGADLISINILGLRLFTAVGLRSGDLCFCFLLRLFSLFLFHFVQLRLQCFALLFQISYTCLVHDLELFPLIRRDTRGR